MSDLFPGFAERRIDVPGARIHARVGGTGPPLLLLHGYPQNLNCWHRIAADLARHRTLVAADLRGYGQSSAPDPDPGHLAYSKRQMAADMVALMAGLGHDRFAVAGHDRGGRVAYRMALDHPGAVERLLVLDIVMTAQVWRAFDWPAALKSYHWPFLAQPHPLPETLISAHPDFYAEWTLQSWCQTRDLSAFDSDALASYRAQMREPDRVRAMCEDYRAGATIDRELDEADLAGGRRIACPLRVLWGTDYVGKSATSPLQLWREIADDVDGTAIPAGHFLAEEAPAETAAALLGYLGAGSA